MATPIAHKGAEAGAKVIAATLMDLLQDEQLLDDAWAYFNDEQGKDGRYEPFITAADPPAIEKNKDIQTKYRTDLQQYYYDAERYNTYLEQLGIEYPNLPAD